MLLHKAPVPLKRKWINYRQGGGVTELKTAVVEEPVAKQPKARQQTEKPVEKTTEFPSELEKYTAQGLDRAKLQAAYEAAPDKAAFLTTLDKAPTIYAKQELIRDFDNIPGVAKGPDPNIRLPDADIPYVDEYGRPDSNLDLPAYDAANFADVKAVPLQPGTKLYRVVGGSARDTGGYWVTEENLPKEYADVIGGTAVKPSWNNSMTEIIEYTVPEEGMVVWEGPAASQPIGNPKSPDHHLPGGENQVFIPNEYRDWRNKEVTNKFLENITKRTPIEWKK